VQSAIHWAEQIMAEIGQEAHLVRPHFLCNHHPMERDRYLGLAFEIEIGFLLDTVAAPYLAPCEKHSCYKEKTKRNLGRSKYSQPILRRERSTDSRESGPARTAPLSVSARVSDMPNFSV
jgi:hypothetical protein